MKAFSTVWLPFAFVASTLAAACSSSSGGGATTDGGPAPAVVSACDAYFDAFVAADCTGMPPTASQIAHQKPRFEAQCASQFGLAGSTYSESALQSCASAIGSLGCGAITQPGGACAFQTTGTLAASEACSSPSQCASGHCGLVTEESRAACGECADAVAAGTTCESFLDCGTGSTCVYPSDGTGSSGTCTAITYGASGATCDGNTALCTAGLACDVASMKCAPLATVGASCTSLPCAAPLVCLPVNGTGPQTCATPTAAGGRCTSSLECAAGLYCDTTSLVCTVIGVAAAGQPCNANTLCTVGGCQSNGTCPAIIADGQPCVFGDETATCDVYAACTDGTCTLTQGACK